jgi:hypothetical protein
MLKSSPVFKGSHFDRPLSELRRLNYCLPPSEVRSEHHSLYRPHLKAFDPDMVVLHLAAIVPLVEGTHRSLPLVLKSNSTHKFNAFLLGS